MGGELAARTERAPTAKGETRGAIVLPARRRRFARADAQHAPASAKDDLVIGVSQFPSSLHPNIDPEVVKTYILDFALRPISVFDKDWHNVCMLCTELPSMDNGMVRLEPAERPSRAWR